MTQRLAWLTDIHLEVLSDSDFDTFMGTIRAENPTGLFISGDIATAPTISNYLKRMLTALDMPIYFVLGNHDFYGSDFDAVHAEIRTLHNTHDKLIWMPEAGIVELNANTALVGHGGWSDGEYGDFMASSIMLNDHIQITSLITTDKAERFRKVQALGRKFAESLKPHLVETVQNFEQVYVLTHSPPFIESCWYGGETPDTDNEYLPHFTCKAIGDLLLTVADANPNHKITVLCGHTHGGGEAHIRPNLHVITGPAEYNQPVVQNVFEV